MIIKTPRSFVEQVLWPQFRELSSALTAYLSEITDRLIREEVHGEMQDAEEVDVRITRWVAMRDPEAHQFRIDNCLKDVTYFDRMVEEAGMTSLLGHATQHLDMLAKADGYGDKFVPGLVDVVTKLNGLPRQGSEPGRLQSGPSALATRSYEQSLILTHDETWPGNSMPVQRDAIEPAKRGRGRPTMGASNANRPPCWE